MTITFRVKNTDEEIELSNFTSIVAGYTGRDAAAVQHHIDELAAIGIAPPVEVPMFYSVEAETVNSDEVYEDSEHLTSGEIEPLYIRHDGTYYLGVASDHTDRDLEREDIELSKRACPKPVGREVVRIGNAEDLVAFSLDQAVARSTVDGKRYQEGTLNGLRTPSDVVSRLIERLGLNAEQNFICLGGTIPLLDGQFTSGDEWVIEIELSDGIRLTHNYRMKGHAK